MNEKAEALKARTRAFALEVLDFVETLPKGTAAVRIAPQLIDAATSVGANYRAACRSRSKAEFAARIGVVLEESDEAAFWLELLDTRGLGSAAMRERLTQEAAELTAIFAASSITARYSLKRP
jgi:four helix bundle protein